MSFFNSLLQNVSNSVANLNLSPKRFSLSKESGQEGPGIPIIEEPPGAAVSGQQRGSTGSVGGGSGLGFPKPLPSPSGAGSSIAPPGGAASGQMLCTSPRRAKTLDGPKRVGSFRQMSTQQRQPLMFCRRRLSWPEIDPHATSGVQETDGSFFESYSALSWKLENRRLMAIHEVAEDETPPSEVSVGIKLPPPFRIQPKEVKKGNKEDDDEEEEEGEKEKKKKRKKKKRKEKKEKKEKKKKEEKKKKRKKKRKEKRKKKKRKKKKEEKKKRKKKKRKKKEEKKKKRKKKKRKKKKEEKKKRKKKKKKEEEKKKKKEGGEEEEQKEFEEGKEESTAEGTLFCKR
ncbi:hypothetical protein M8J76_016031 [Diaphorina citri]|nr:hypothetical protein M8J76_016031 [Diaphorina citri]